MPRAARKKEMGIYRLINLANGKVYIGSSADLKLRLYEHRRALSKGTHNNCHLQAAWNQHGEESFHFEVVEMHTVTSEMLAAEKRHILAMQCHDREFGYNISTEPSNNQLGLKRSAETCRRIGEAKKGNKNRLGKGFTEEAKQRIAASLRGNKASEETRRKLSVARKGKPKPASFGQKISVLLKGHEVPWWQREMIRCKLKGLPVPPEVLASRALHFATKKNGAP